MKKLLSFVIALAWCLSMSIPALAAGKPGDTVVMDTSGNTYTLSNAILYTVSQDQLKHIPLSKRYFVDETLDDYFTYIIGDETRALKELPLQNVTQAYAVPVGTKITAPDRMNFEGFIWIDTKNEKGIYCAVDSGMGTPLWNEITLDDEDGNTIWILPCYIASEADIGENTNSIGGGSEVGGINRTYVSTIAFFTPSKDNIKTNPFASAAPVSPSTSTSPANPAFTDVAANAYYAAPVSWAVEKRITSGTTTTTFSPGQTCSTAQILTFLWRAKGSPEPAGKTNTFTDIKESDYFYKAALWAKEKGLVSGTSFRGNTPCTRSMVVNYLWKLAGSPSAPSASFNDLASTADYAKAVAWAVSKGITGGTTADTFSPDNTCTRGQIVTFLYRAYK